MFGTHCRDAKQGLTILFTARGNGIAATQHTSHKEEARRQLLQEHNTLALVTSGEKDENGSGCDARPAMHGELTRASVAKRGHIRRIKQPPITHQQIN